MQEHVADLAREEAVGMRGGISVHESSGAAGASGSGRLGGLDLGEQVEKRNLVDIVVERLTSAIGSGGLQPGDELPSEAALCEMLGVSRTVIREGLRHLSAFGMLELSSGRPARVMALNSKALGVYFDWAIRVKPEAIVEIQQLRAAVEGAAASLTAIRISDEERNEFRDLLELLDGARSDIERYAELDLMLHMKLTELSRNPLLFDVIDASRPRLEFAIRTGLERLATMPGGISDVHEQHVAIVEAVVAADADRARQLVELHVLGAGDRILTELEMTQSGN